MDLASSTISPPTAEQPAPFLFLAGNKPWVCALADALAHHAPVHATATCDWNVYWNHPPTWPDSSPGADLDFSTRVLPTGYASHLEPFVRPYMKRVVQSWYEELVRPDRPPPWVVTTRPFTEPWTRSLPDHRLIYYNLDDYALYRPERAERIEAQEDELIRRASLVLCLSRYQVDALSERHPDRSDDIRHFPLGVTEAFLNPQPKIPPTPDTVGYVGNLSDRVDWPLVASVVGQCSDLRFVFVGRAEESPSEAWSDARDYVFAQEHVEHVGYVPQEEVTRYYWSSAVNWVPYDLNHPFNQAACPTKIMDSLGSGRPVVSTPTPEFQLYDDWISLAQTPDPIAEALRNAAATHNPSRNRAQVAFAAQHTWPHRASQLLNWLHPQV
jgi:glycosyltransferase involved in cell wall biosynthesis